ncbi:uncharacterized protein LOC113513390 [Galleria mellonella]|uniref:Uncharacterized protein LOC113513390 n=1 Tax=Galleria mellonella TaxID=7137 RepID=A0A6J1WGK3_GALME|nr:uncharacterized protein LOC113513390 [Galleria mellonella]
MLDCNSPRKVTSRRRISYKPSAWKVHQFEIWSGELVCRVAVLRADRCLFLWLGGTAGKPELGEMSMGVPAPEGLLQGCSRGGLATTLLGADGTSTAMARRLAASLQRPVYVCSSCTLDRFTIPIVERGLISEIKNRPECF